MLSNTLTAAAVLAALPAVLGQTFTNCNPLSQTCPANPGLAQASWSRDFSSGDLSQFSNLGGIPITSGADGAQFTITADGQAPTLGSSFYIFFGRVDVVMKAAPGVGIVSSIVLESQDLDEIDWEFLGGDTAQAQTNFFGKGDISTYDRGAFHQVAAPQSQFHTYSIDWTQERIQWLIDGNVVRTLPYSSPVAKGGATYPQTPAQLKLGSWVAGGANNAPGTVQWAGGKTDFSQAPFTMYIKSVSIKNYNPAASYTYGDHSGSYQSIVKSGAVAGSPPAGDAPVSSKPVTTVTVPQTSLATQSLTKLGPVVVPLQSNSIFATTTATVVTSSKPVTLSTSVTSATASNLIGTSSTTSSATQTSVRPTSTGAASAVHVYAGGSLLSLAAAFFLF